MIGLIRPHSIPACLSLAKLDPPVLSSLLILMLDSDLAIGADSQSLIRRPDKYSRLLHIVTCCIPTLDRSMTLRNLEVRPIRRFTTMVKFKRILLRSPQVYPKLLTLKACQVIRWNNHDTTHDGTLNLPKNQKRKHNLWWARGDLNPGPPPCQGGVLTRLDDGPSPPVQGLLVVSIV